MASAEPPSKRRKLAMSESYSVVVGTGVEKKTSTVHKCYITKSSEFFKAACNKEWKEGQTKTIELPEEKPACFEVYLQWLYTGELVVTEKVMPSVGAAKDVRDAYATAVYGMLVDLYCHTNMLLDVCCGNDVQDMLVAVGRNTDFMPGPLLVKHAHERTTKHLALRPPLVDMHIHVVPETFDKGHETFAREFLMELAARMLGLLASQDVGRPYEGPKCTYHEHNNTCPPCK